jgi:hypothetical protein
MKETHDRHNAIKGRCMTTVAGTINETLDR